MKGGFGRRLMTMAPMRSFKCYACGHEWQEPFGTGRPAVCPKCHSMNIHRNEPGRGPSGTDDAAWNRSRASSVQGRGRGGTRGSPRRGT